MNKLITDEELIVLIMQENLKAFITLYERYKLYSFGVAKDYFFKNDNGVSIDSLSSIAIFSFYVAIKKYNLHLKSSFYPYWRTIAKNELVSYLNDNIYSQAAKINSSSISLNQRANEECRYELNDILGKDDEQINFSLTCVELLNKVKNDPFHKFNDFDYSILKLLFEGYDEEQIALKFNTTERRIKYRLVKIKKFLKEMN